MCGFGVVVVFYLFGIESDVEVYCCVVWFEFVEYDFFDVFFCCEVDDCLVGVIIVVGE